MFAALHDGLSHIRNYSPAADPMSTLGCLAELGVTITQIDQDDGLELKIQGVGRNGFIQPTRDLDCGNAGTAMRLLAGMVGGAGVQATLTGDDSLSGRTMKRIIEPLRRMGITIEARDDDFAPLRISRQGPVKPLHFPLPIPSAQLKSCVLLAGLFGEEPTEVIETLPSRDHTERLLRLPVRQENGKRIISSSAEQTISNQSYRVPGDFSAAAFWLVAGSLAGEGEIRLPGTGVNPSRKGALELLQRMGGDITLENEVFEGAEPVADLVVKPTELRPLIIEGRDVPNAIDELPVLAVAMAFADGKSEIRDAAELRHKETDRLDAMAEIFRLAEVDFEEKRDGLVIYGRPDFKPAPATLPSYHDHRIAMAGAVLALRSSGEMVIRDAECASISYPDFWEHLDLLTN